MTTASTSSTQFRTRKGKQRETGVTRDEGEGGNGGIVLPLELISGTAYDAVYTIPILVGSNQQNFSLQVDTGSSDLWIASTSCSSSACSGAKGHLYNPSTSTSTGKAFNINYLSGEVSGPIVWDMVQLGNYNIETQALAAATYVSNEPLNSAFSGILGLALPLNSVIAGKIPPTITNNPDGAAFSANLFGISPASASPAAPFYSLALERPGSTTIPSVLGIGRHPSELVTDPSQVHYASVVADQQGDFFWKANIRAITVYVNGEAKVVALSHSTTGAVFPTAIIDSGMPIILATANIANGIYGALGIGPAADGQYYVPCTTPINMTIKLDGRPDIPLHPLDLTYEPSSSATSDMCIGAIQNANAFGSAITQTSDMILGVPFMRNTYTVMAMNPPDSGGRFDLNYTYSESLVNDIRPYLGLMSLTDPTTALEEFNQVRVLKQPLSTGSPSAQTAEGATDTASGKHLSVGVEVLLGLVGFVVFCFVLFSARWAYVRRKWRSTQNASVEGGNWKDGYAMNNVAYRLAHRRSPSEYEGDGGLSEETLRTLRYEEYKKRMGAQERYEDDTARTRVNEDADEFGMTFGKHMQHKRGDSMRSQSDVDDAGVVLLPTPPMLDMPLSPPAEIHADPPLPRTVHLRDGYDSPPDSAHRRTLSGEAGIAMPLLRHTRRDSVMSGVDMMGGDDTDGRLSMAGVGTAARRSMISTGNTLRGSVLNLEDQQEGAATIATLNGGLRVPERAASPLSIGTPPAETVSFDTLNGHGR